MSEASRATSKAANPAASMKVTPVMSRRTRWPLNASARVSTNRQTPRSYWSRGPPDELEGATFAAHTADSRPGARSVLVPRQVSPKHLGAPSGLHEQPETLQVIMSDSSLCPRAISLAASSG